MEANKLKQANLRMQRAKKALERNGMEVSCYDTLQEAVDTIDALIEDGSIISDGGSQTLVESGLIERLQTKKVDYESHNQPHSIEEKYRITRKAFNADYFLCSSNAITMNGELINIDGNGNRVAAMIFGPKKVIVIAGINKLVEDEQEAISRIKHISAPTNAIRLNRNTPCALCGNCADCLSDDRICSAYVKINHCNNKRIHVFLFAQEGGY